MSNKGNLELFLHENKIHILAIFKSRLILNIIITKLSDQIDFTEKEVQWRYQLFSSSFFFIIIGYSVIQLVIQLCGFRVSLHDRKSLSIISCYCKPGYYISGDEVTTLLQNVSNPLLFLVVFYEHPQLNEYALFKEIEFY